MKTTTKTERADVYQIVTDRITAQLEQGIIPWDKPWTGTASGAISATTGKPYSLLNQLILGKAGKWYTWKQITERGAHVRKGEKSSVCVFWKQVKITVQDKDGNDVEKLVPMLRYYNVFHASQIDGLPEEPEEIPAEVVTDADADEIINGYTAAEGIRLDLVKGNEAFYSPARDLVQLPLREQFPEWAEFYSTAFHELTHSTGHKSRLDRFGKSGAAAAFGSEDYSKEELVAEIGSAMMMHLTGIETTHSSRNSAAYIQGWLRALRDDRKLIVSAASKAAAAVEFILDHCTA